MTDEEKIYQLKVDYLRANSEFFRHTAGSGTYNKIKQEEATVAMQQARNQYFRLTGERIHDTLFLKDRSTRMCEGLEIAAKLKLYGYKK